MYQELENLFLLTTTLHVDWLNWKSALTTDKPTVKYQRRSGYSRHNQMYGQHTYSLVMVSSSPVPSETSSLHPSLLSAAAAVLILQRVTIKLPNVM